MGNELGRGAMGVIYRARQPFLGRQVAVKKLLRPDDARTAARFQREIKALGKVKHPNLVQIFAWGLEGKQWYYAMELVEGASLSAVTGHLKTQTPSVTQVDLPAWQKSLAQLSGQTRGTEPAARSSDEGNAALRPPPAQTGSRPQVGRKYVEHIVKLVQQVAGAAHALHEGGILHRDIKPDNIVVSADGNQAFLMDLGLAQLADDQEGRLYHTRESIRTLRYASPQQVLAVADLDRRTDVYSLGATLWELLSLQPLFGVTEKTPASVLMEKIRREEPERLGTFHLGISPDSRRDLEAIVHRCLKKEPEKRYATAQDLARDLERFLRGEPVDPATSPVRNSERAPTERPRTRYDDLRPNYEPIPGYRLEKRLGKGGFGEVWKATGPGGFSLALKFVSLNGELGTKELHSLEAMKALRHPTLLAISGSWQVGGFLIIAMELADKTLSDQLQEFVRMGLPGIPRDELIRYMQEAAKGIDYLNRPDHRIGDSTKAAIQHRDIKPQNILLMGGGVKIGDFGLIRILKNTVTEHTGSLTLAYAAPEFLMGHTARSSDQYSFAVTYCYLRGGRLPFFGSPGQIMQGHLEGRPDLTMIPVEERASVQRALDKDPERRWSTCEEFVNALATCHVLGSTDTTERISVRGRRTTLTASHGLWMGFGVVLLLVVAGLWIWLSSSRDQVDPAKPSPSSKKREWAPLFNGRNLDGWKVRSNDTGNWSVVNGAIKGGGKFNHLYTVRDDFSDFHLRVEAQISDGDSGVIFRAKFGPWLSDAYEAQISSERRRRIRPVNPLTGSILKFKGATVQVGSLAKSNVVSDGRWFTLEVIARGNTFTTKIDGKTIAEFHEHGAFYARGHIGLQQDTPETLVRFRRIELLEPPEN
jgi:serine/threonine protein kinase